MYLIFIIFVNFVISVVNSQSIEKLTDYYKTESIQRFRDMWDSYRKPLENALEAALKETVGVPGMNVYVRKKKETVTNGYYHSDNQIKLIMKDLRIDTYPRCWLPEVQFSLVSNILKIQTNLSPMIMHADYSLVRNKSDIIYDPDKQDPSKASPFLFQPVQDVGRVAISMDGCVLSGFLITTLNGESVNLGYQHFEIMHCLYIIEIYREGDDSPPVIARYNPYSSDNGLTITQLLLRQLNEELLPKLQGAMFSFVNTSSIFGERLQEFIENQEEVFKITSQHLTEVVRKLNKITIEINQGTVEMKNYILHWNDGRFKDANNSQKSVGEQLRLTNMVLTGLDTLYSSHTGGPFRMNSVMVAEELRFSSLQIRGYVDVNSSWSDRYSFASVISDLAVDIQLEIQSGRSSQKKKSRIPPHFGLKNIEVTSYRRITFAVPSVIFGSAEALIAGYLLNAVPKLVTAHLSAIFPKALQPTNSLDLESDEDNDRELNCKGVDSYNEDEESDIGKNFGIVINDQSSEIQKYHSGKNLAKRDMFHKNKKRFKSFSKQSLADRKAKLRAKCKAMKNSQKFKSQNKQ